MSRLTTSCRPADVARAFRDHFGLAEIYLADLDALSGSPPALPTYAGLARLGFRLWVDAGMRDVADAAPLLAAGVERVVAGLETIAGPKVLEAICHTVGRDRTVFSLDLHEAVPLGNRSAWEAGDAWGVAAKAVAAGVRSLIVLDLAQVGLGRGPGTLELCRRLVAAYPGLELIAGGGIRGLEDVYRLKAAGVRVALVASALHEGRLCPEDLAALQEPPGAASAGRHS